MINGFRIIRNVGQFDSFTAGENSNFSKLTLISADNGRGKTTIASVFRSLGDGNANHISERKRLASTNNPHIIIDCAGSTNATFHNNNWDRTLPQIMVFDDTFVDQNIYSGLSVSSDHRQNLNELILGNQGVVLNNQLKQHVEQIEGHNRALRVKESTVLREDLGSLSMDAFCDLENVENIDFAIQTTERSLISAQEQVRIHAESLFASISLPEFDMITINEILQRNLLSLDLSASSQVKQHFSSLGNSGESWISDGIHRLGDFEATSTNCPFCLQSLNLSPIITHYQSYFSSEYTNLKLDISNLNSNINRLHGTGATVAFEREIRIWLEKKQFWSRYTDLPEIVLDITSIAQCREAAYHAVMECLNVKQADPLASTVLSENAISSILLYNNIRQRLEDLNNSLQAANSNLTVIKAVAIAGNIPALILDLKKLKIVKKRYTLENISICDEYILEKSAKTRAEEQRDLAKAVLNDYQRSIFPVYSGSINNYLQAFNADFRISNVESINNRGGNTCNYKIVVNNNAVAVSGSSNTIGNPSFRNILSAGDRHTLALAFFFASLDHDLNIADKIVVIDDPMTSLDQHRLMTTIQQIRRLLSRVTQVIVLSHRKSFLYKIWEPVNVAHKTTLELVRDGAGSKILHWDISKDRITDYDKRHAVLRNYLINPINNMEAAIVIRPLLEGYFRVSCPEHFEAGYMLGNFRENCEQRIRDGRELILNQDDTLELRELIEYANLFHHDTNDAFESTVINDAELVGFIRRTLAFVKF